MLKIVIACIAALAVSPASAACFGSDSFSTCTDDSGNTYNVQRYGNQTNVQGYSSNGSTWSQQSTTMGNTTIHSGTSADGGNWNSTETRFGGNRTIYGTDSDGNSFSRNCYGSSCY